MDEQDLEWLEAVNAERKKDLIDKITFETFEVIMDRLEKEWFDLVRSYITSIECSALTRIRLDQESTKA